MTDHAPLDDGFVQVSMGDITLQRVDAIVNAANSSLLGGGGVDGAIHRVAGPELLEACRRIGGCPPGEARITPGFRLPARFVIHTVGPIWHGGEQGEDEILARCYRSSMVLAANQRLTSIAFPSISTGAYGFPVHRAARIAVRELRNCLDRFEDIEDVRIICFGASTFAAYESAMQDYLE
jgi:O-acetyl-ADP-ribose deacetylase (regulator of RNase III)